MKTREAGSNPGEIARTTLRDDQGRLLYHRSILAKIVCVDRGVRMRARAIAAKPHFTAGSWTIEFCRVLITSVTVSRRLSFHHLVHTLIRAC